MPAFDAWTCLIRTTPFPLRQGGDTRALDKNLIDQKRRERQVATTSKSSYYIESVLS